jgi:hypothetical protein
MLGETEMPQCFWTNRITIALGLSAPRKLARNGLRGGENATELRREFASPKRPAITSGEPVYRPRIARWCPCGQSHHTIAIATRSISETSSLRPTGQR